MDTLESNGAYSQAEQGGAIEQSMKRPRICVDVGIVAAGFGQLTKLTQLNLSANRLNGKNYCGGASWTTLWPRQLKFFISTRFFNKFAFYIKYELSIFTSMIPENLS